MKYLALALIAIVLITPVTLSLTNLDSPFVKSGAAGSLSSVEGWKVNVTEPIYIYNISKYKLTGASKCYITNDTFHVLKEGNFTSDECFLGQFYLDRGIYRFLVDDDGSNYKIYGDTNPPAVPFPYDNVYREINITSAGRIGDSTNEVYGVTGVAFNNVLGGQNTTRYPYPYGTALAGALSGKQGWRITTKQTIRLVDIGKRYNNGATKCYLYDDEFNLLNNGTFVTNVCRMPYQLVYNTTYRVMVDDAGSNYAIRGDSSVSLPYTGYEDFDIISNAVEGESTSEIYGFMNITVDSQRFDINVYSEEDGKTHLSNVLINAFGDDSYFVDTISEALRISTLTTGTNTIKYSKNGFFTRYYTFNSTYSPFKTNINLYLLNQSTTNSALITYTVTDENSVPDPGVTIKALRLYSETNSYVEVANSVSDINGEGGLHLEKIVPFYKFILEKNGQVLLTTEGAQIFNDEIIIRADQSENVIESIAAIAGLSESLTFDNSTNEFTYIYNDAEGIVNEVCLIVEKIEGFGVKQINQTCLTGSSAGSITLGSGGTGIKGNYQARTTIETTTAFSPHTGAILSVVLGGAPLILGTLGVFLAALFITGMALTGMFIFKSGAAIIFLTVIGYILSGAVGLLTVTIPTAITVLAIGGIAIYLTSKMGGNQ